MAKLKRKKYRFAIVSDTHIGADTSRLDLLADFYKRLKRKGIDLVLHAGDLTDGVKVYRGQEEHLIDNTPEKQAKRVIEEYPKLADVLTAFITGNHDLKQKGFNVANMITRGFTYEYGSGQKEEIPGRNDMKYLGKYRARVELPYGIHVDVVHGSGGGAYARSYPIQKYLRNLPAKDYPHILVMGHHHTADYFRPQGVHSFMAGAFKDADEWNIRRGKFPDLGGWIIEYEVEKDGEIRYIKPEFVGYQGKGLWRIPGLKKDDKHE